MTRGIRVEIAGTVILFLAGLISQLKLWKLVKKHRERQATHRLKHEENLEQLESEAGRRIQDDINRERAQWEAVYGDKGTSDDKTCKTAIGSVGEVRGSTPESMEMNDLGSGREESRTDLLSKHTSKHKFGSGVTVRVARDDDVPQLDDDGNPFADELEDLDGDAKKRRNSASSAATHSDLKSSTRADKSDFVSSKSSLHSNVPPPPEIIPLPFMIPTEDDPEAGDNSSVSTAPETIYERRQASKHPLRARLLKRLSVGAQSEGFPEPEEEFVVPHIEDDRASSIAATIDDLDDDNTSLPALSLPPSPYKMVFDEKDKQRQTIRIVSSVDPGQLLVDISEDPATEAEAEAEIEEMDPERMETIVAAERPVQSFPLTPSTDPRESDSKNRLMRRSSRRRSGVSSSNKDMELRLSKSGSNKSLARSDASHMASREGDLMDHLPENLSKVAMSYRTNEWAKHLEAAEKPGLDEIAEPSSPGIKVDHGFAETCATIPESPPLVSAFRRSSTGPRQEWRNSRSAPAAGGNVPNGHRYPPVGSYAAVPSMTALPPMQGSTATLLGKRSDILRNKMSSVSFMPYASTPNVAVIAPSDSASARGVRLDKIDSDNISLSERKRQIDQEDMTLAERRELIQRQNQERRQDTWPLPQRQTFNFDSHQPARGPALNDERREMMLANWRQSVRHELNASQPLLADEGRRAAMLNDRRQQQVADQQRTMAANHRDSVFDSMMRRGDMLDLHKEAMRRMQASANRHA